MSVRPTLLSAGCSLIYGSELSDSPNYSGQDPPSLKTWPALYADSKNYIYKTCACCGISNQGIARYVIDAVELINPDFVIVQWTFFDRHEIRLNDATLNNNQSHYYLLTPYLSEDANAYYDSEIINIKKNLNSVIKYIATMWYRHVDSDETEYYNYLKTKLDLANYLRYKNIPFIFANSQSKLLNVEQVTTDRSLRTLINLDKDIPEIDFNSQGFYNWARSSNYVFGVDHPLDQAHRAAYDLVYTTIDNYFSIKN
jgi:hypothetical protein